MDIRPMSPVRRDPKVYKAYSQFKNRIFQLSVDFSFLLLFTYKTIKTRLKIDLSELPFLLGTPGIGAKSLNRSSNPKLPNPKPPPP